MKRDLDLDRETNSEGSCWFGTSSENVERAAMASSTGTAITNSSGKLEGEKQSLTHRTKKKDQLLQTIASFLSQNLHCLCGESLQLQGWAGRQVQCNFRVD